MSGHWVACVVQCFVCNVMLPNSRYIFQIYFIIFHYTLCSNPLDFDFKSCECDQFECCIDIYIYSHMYGQNILLNTTYMASLLHIFGLWPQSTTSTIQMRLMGRLLLSVICQYYSSHTFVTSPVSIGRNGLLQAVKWICMKSIVAVGQVVAEPDRMVNIFLDEFELESGAPKY